MYKIFNFCLTLLFLLGLNPVAAKEQSWDEVLKEAKGKTIYFNAWGGSEVINDYIAWASSEVKAKYGIDVKFVKLVDSANAVKRILAEKKSGVQNKGSIDVLWVNGENFAALKKNDLLSKPFVNLLPNNKYLDYENKPLTLDFTLATEGKEAPWGSAQLIFFYDSKRVKNPPQTANELLSWVQANKGKFTYPKIPDFHGVSFLKQLLLSLNPNKQARAMLQLPVTTQNFNKLSAPLWQYLDAIRPYLWYQGKKHPKNIEGINLMIQDRVLDLGFNFNPFIVDNMVRAGKLAQSFRSYTFKEGTLGNIHFLAIPYNTQARAAAMVFINFMLSAQAQARKANPQYWGDPYVLSLNKLSKQDKKLFDSIKYTDAAPKKLNQILPELHSSWVDKLESEWLRRYNF